MSLTAGATLQNQKYVIQKLLHQSDFGVTYQAQHAYLAQPVALQTLNDCLHQRSDFAQLRQQFFSKVRSLSQQVGATARVLDCFEENGMPFVVFELAPGQSPPQMSDWFSLLPHSVKPIDSVLEAANSNAAKPDAPVAASLSASPSIATDETLPPALPTTTPTQPALSSHLSPHSFHNTSKLSLLMAATQVINLPQPRARSKAWMPLALMSMSMIGGLLGAGFGLSLRLAPTPKAESESKLSPHLFSRQQSFPSEAEWPISETPQFFTPDPTPVEEPVYRTSPSTENYTPPSFQPLPSEVKVQAPAPTSSSEPTTKATTPVKPNLPDPLPSALPTIPPDPTLTTPPTALSAPAEPAPTEPAPLPIVPAETAPATPDLPVLEPTTPEIPALPAKKPPVVRQ